MFCAHNHCGNSTLPVYNAAIMAAQNLENSLPSSRSMPWLKKITLFVAISPPGRWLVKNVVSRLDIWLYHFSKGRLSFTRLLGFPVLILVTKGVRSGVLRETPLLYARNNENVAVIASSLGSAHHPQWYRNLLANPEASLYFDGHQSLYSYRQLEGEERQEYWQRMQEVYPGYNRYAELAGGRHIPVILFSPLE